MQPNNEQKKYESLSKAAEMSNCTSPALSAKCNTSKQHIRHKRHYYTHKCTIVNVSLLSTADNKITRTEIITLVIL